MEVNGAQINDSIIRKIQLLFEMANKKFNNDGTSNENEASAAMAKAQELLAKYNLELSMVQEAQVAGGAGAGQEEKREKTQFARSAMYKWQVKLCRAICESNFCFYWTVETIDYYQISGGAKKKFDRPRKVKRHVILGRESSTKVAEMMYTYLADTLERLIPFTGPERLSRSAVSWREGCVDRLIERIEEKAEAMKREAASQSASGCTAMTIRDVHEKEYAANYDAEHGKGAYARMKARNAEWEREAAERRKSREEEEARMLAGETPEEQEAREKKETKEAAKQRARDAKWWERYHAREAREAARKDMVAYAKGHQKANDINLDSQLDAGKGKGRLS